MPNIWLTSDPHLGHDVGARHRGYESVEEHDNAVLTMLGRFRREAYGTLFILGDLAFGADKEEQLDKLARAVYSFSARGEVVVVLGNHDRAHPMNNFSWRYKQHVERRGFHVVTSASVNHEGTRYNLSHFPYDGDHTEEDRYNEWRLQDTGKPLIHGHVHTDERLTFSKRGTPQIHVGPDAWGFQRLVRLSDVHALTKTALTTISA